jgi:uncharacterized damage-inducible protein DinB
LIVGVIPLPSFKKGNAMAMAESEVARLFLEFSRHQLIDQDWPRLRSCVEPLSADQVWWRPNEASNSIGNLILHLNGNVRQWLLVSFNELEDARDRPAEFDAREGGSATELLDQLGTTMQNVSELLGRLTEAELLASYEIQGYRVRGLDAVYHVVEHFGMHYGQIVYIAKSLTGVDLGFYRELNATGRASSGKNP